MAKPIANVEKFNILKFLRRKEGRSSFLGINFRASMLGGTVQAEMTRVVVDGEKEKDGDCLER